MKQRKRWVFIAGSGVLIIALGIQAFLGLAGFDLEYQNAIQNTWLEQLVRIRSHIEQAQTLDSSTARVSDISMILEQARTTIKAPQELYVCDVDGNILATTGTESIGAQFVDKQFMFQFGQTETVEKSSKHRFFATVHDSWLGIPLHGGSGAIRGGLWLRLDPETHNTRFLNLLSVYLSLLVIIATLTIFVLRFILSRQKRRLRLVFFILTLTSMLIYGLCTMRLNQMEYEKVFVEAAGAQANGIVYVCTQLLAYGLTPDHWKNMDKVLAGTLEQSRTVQEVIISDTNGAILYRVGRGGGNVSSTHLNKENYTVSSPGRMVYPIEHRGLSVAYVCISLDRAWIENAMLELLFDMFTVLLISSLFGLELYFILMSISNQPQIKRVRDIQTIRASSFMFFFSALMPLSFIPVFLDGVISSSMSNLNPDTRHVLLGIPMTSYLVGLAVMAPITTVLSRRYTPRFTLILAALLSFVGNVSTLFITDYYLIVVARFIAGAGFGVAIIAGSNLVLHLTKSAHRPRGFQNWTTGFATATVVSLSLGGILAARFGYQAALVTSAVCSLMFAVYVLLNGRGPGWNSVLAQDGLKRKEMFQVIRNRNLSAMLFLSSLPMQLATVGLFQYIIPLYMSSQGESPASIGRVITVYGLVGIFGPLWRRLVPGRQSERMLIVAGSFITGICLLYFFITQRIEVLIFAVAAIGMGSLIVDHVSESYVRRALGTSVPSDEHAIDLYLSYNRLVTIMVPVLCTIILGLFGMVGSIGVIGIAILVGSTIFSILSEHWESKASHQSV